MYLIDSILREIRRMASSRLYIAMMVVVPVGCALFFLSLLKPGLPTKVPTAIVDYDNSEMSRGVTRSLQSTQLVDISLKLENYEQAMERVRSGDIYGFFVIPANFQADAIAGRKPSLDYYSNMTYFVPGTLSFKGFKTVAVTTAGGVVAAKLTAVGMSPDAIGAMMQPVVISASGVGNPWTNYSYYLTPSFTFATLALIIMLMTVYTITIEIKQHTSPAWLDTAGGSIVVAVTGKLLPQTVVFTVVGLCIEALMFGYNHFPMAGSLGWMTLALLLFVPASQALGLFICCVLPNPRLAFSVVSLVGILTFSFAGFSFPVDKMYGAIGIFSYFVPVRYLFLIYVNIVLNGFSPYYVRYYYIALVIFMFVGALCLGRLKRAAINPVYVP